MAFNVEDGSASADAESYASVAEADAYHLARGNVAWAVAAQIAKEQALRRATDHMGQAYGACWMGQRTSSDQALDWPRSGVPVRGGSAWACYAPDEIPPEVRRACMELALRTLGGALAPDQGPAVKRERLGLIETEYQDSGAAGPSYPAVDRLLSPLLAGSARLVRR